MIQSNKLSYDSIMVAATFHCSCRLTGVNVHYLIITSSKVLFRMSVKTRNIVVNLIKYGMLDQGQNRRVHSTFDGHDG